MLAALYQRAFVGGWGNTEVAQLRKEANEERGERRLFATFRFSTFAKIFFIRGGILLLMKYQQEHIEPVRWAPDIIYFWHTACSGDNLAHFLTFSPEGCW